MSDSGSAGVGPSGPGAARAGLRLPDDLVAIGTALRRELALAAALPGHAWRTGTLATIDGDRADARTVVVRGYDDTARCLTMLTDARSPKVRQIGISPMGTLLLWSPALKWQLRLSVTLSVQTDGAMVRARWAALAATPAARDYTASTPPGSPLDRGSPAGGSVTGRPLTGEMLPDGLQRAGPPAREPIPPSGPDAHHLAILTASITAIDWLELHAEGHRRAAFDAEGERWLVP